MVFILAEAVVTVVDDEPGTLVQLSVGREAQHSMPDELLAPSSSSLEVLLFLMMYLSIVFQ